MRPLAWRASAFSFSAMMTFLDGSASRRAMPVARPTTPVPGMRTSDFCSMGYDVIHIRVGAVWSKFKSWNKLLSMTSDIESAKGDNSNQAIVYIDGFNFYRRIVDKTPYKWLDLELMCSQLLKGYEISKIKYFTARVHPTPHNRQQDIRQNTYFRALGTNPKIEIYLGQFVSSERRFPVHPWAYDKDGRPEMTKVKYSQEKGSDVNLASHLVFDVLNQRADAYVVVSNDSDQVGPLKLLKTETNAKLGLILPSHNTAQKLLDLKLPIIRKIRKGVLASSLYPDFMTDVNGKFSKPLSW